MNKSVILNKLIILIGFLQRFKLVKIKLYYSKVTRKIKRELIYYLVKASGETLFDYLYLSENKLYLFWLLKNSPRKSDLHKQKKISNIFKVRPLFSVFLIVYNEDLSLVLKIIDSILNQSYLHFELILLCSDSQKSHLSTYINKLNPTLLLPVQFIVFDRSENPYEKINLNLTKARGEFLSFLESDGLLAPNALCETAVYINKSKNNVDILYSNEDQIGKSSQFHENPFFKPEWCPDSFLSRNYLGQFVVYSKSTVTQLGGIRASKGEAALYDLSLRISERESFNIVHIPEVLYHKISAISFDLNNNKKTDFIDVISEAIIRRNERGYVEINQFGFPLVRYNIDSSDLVSIIIPTRNLGNILDKCLQSIFEKTQYQNFEVIVIDNGSTEVETIQVIQKWKDQEPNRFYSYVLDIPFNFSRINNDAVTRAKGKYLLFLNNDTEVITSDWLGALVEQAQRPSIGAVGALLLYPDQTVQHAGVIVGLGGVANHSQQYVSSTQTGYFGQLHSINNYLAVTAACLMCRRETFNEVSGFTEDLSIAFNDVDFCLKLIEKGYQNVYLPHVMLYHYESKSRGYDVFGERLKRFNNEIEFMQKHWSKYIDFDPCYNLSLFK